MRGPPSSRRPLRDPRGAVTWVTMLLFVVVAGVAYLGWVWAPVYLDHYAVRQAVRASMNEAVKDHDDAALVRNLCQKIQAIRTVDGIDAMGRTVPVPAVVVEERQVSWTRDETVNPPMLRVTIEYERQVEYPFIRRTGSKVFVVSETNDLAVPNWAPAR